MYYRLTYVSSSVNKERIGDYVISGGKPLNIGQGNGSHIQLPDSDLYEPQLFATILLREDGNGWFIVRRTDCYQILVNGVEMSVAQSLCNGDVLSFNDGSFKTELKFQVFTDGDYDANSGFIYQKHNRIKTVSLITAILAIVVAFLTVYTFTSNRHEQDLRHKDFSSINGSVYHITTDAVYLLCDSLINGEHQHVIVDAIELDNVAAGTAFLTTDSLFVTARHCIEPWINDEKWDGVSSKLRMSPEVRLATTAETGNRLSGSSKYSLRSHCIISRGQERYEFFSTDFHMNQARDLVMRLGSAGDVIYLRTIIPIAQRRDMELGDFAYVKAEKPGILMLADWPDLLSFSNHAANHDIAVIGYPLSDNDTDGDAVPVYGNLMGMEFNADSTNLKGCIQMSAPINRGNSGGPILALIDKKIKVVGIVSKADERAEQGVFWAVPATEVVSLHKKGDSAAEDIPIYRR